MDGINGNDEDIVTLFSDPELDWLEHGMIAQLRLDGLDVLKVYMSNLVKQCVFCVFELLAEMAHVPVIPTPFR